MPKRLWVSLAMGSAGLLLVVTSVLWSTGRIDLPGPFRTLRTVPRDDRSGEMGPSSAVSVPDRGREFRERLLASIWREQLITVTVHVALCDSRLSKVANPNQGRGDSFRENLYWGAMYGVETFFSRQGDWKFVHADAGRDPHVLRRVVFLRRASPTEEWRQRGVTKPFDICLLAQAWAGPYAADAMRAALNDGLGAKPPVVIEIGNRRIPFGSGSHLVGYVGYNALKDGHTILPNPNEDLPKPEARGIFYICASSADYLAIPLRQLGLYPVLLTTQHITPEAYVLHGLTETLANGQIETGFALQAAQEYAHYNRMVPNEARRIFVQ